jgi:hypothetical protein
MSLVNPIAKTAVKAPTRMVQKVLYVKSALLDGGTINKAKKWLQHARNVARENGLPPLLKFLKPLAKIVVWQSIRPRSVQLLNRRVLHVLLVNSV